METQKCKGARDLLPVDMERFRQVEDAFLNSCLNWGYREIKTPTLEYIHLFTQAGTLTPAMLGRVYFVPGLGRLGRRAHRPETGRHHPRSTAVHREHARPENRQALLYNQYFRL